MDTISIGILGLLAGIVVLVGVSACLAKNSGDARINAASRWFLVGLRLVIGWHFLIEGLEKFHTPTWSSEAYLRESSGPLAPWFRELAGDRLVDKLTVGADGKLPAELELEWQAYFDAFVKFYQLNDESAQKAKGIVDQAKSKTLSWLTSAKQPVQVTSTYPPPYTAELTVAERLERHGQLEEKVREVETNIPRYGNEVFTKYKNAKADLAKWRADLKKDLGQQFQALQRDLRDGVLLPLLPELAPEPYRAKLLPPKFDDKVKPAEREKKEKDWLANIPAVYLQMRLAQDQGSDVKVDPQLAKIFVTAFTSKAGDSAGVELLPAAPSRPLETWTFLDWSDAIVKYGLVIVGACLLLGFLTRTACLAGAGFLLMFFLAMPPLPGWPENPRAEGHYLYINKNVIEMFALLALATMRSGRWAGIDAWLQFLRPSRWRGPAASGNVKGHV